MPAFPPLRLPRPLALLFAALPLLFALAGPALAHSALSTAVPAVDGIATEPVLRLELTFAQAVDVLPDDVVATSGDGTVVVGAAQRLADGLTVRVDLPDPLGDGAWTVDWRVIGGDGHPIEGSYAFTIDAPESATDGAPAHGTAADPISDPAQSVPAATATGGADESAAEGTDGPTATPQVTDPASTPTVAPEVTSPATSAGATPSPTTNPSDVAGVVTTGGGVPPSSQDGLPQSVDTTAGWLVYTGVMVTVGAALFGLAVHPDTGRDADVLRRIVVGGAVLAATASVVQLAAHVALLSGEGMAGALDPAALQVARRNGGFAAPLLRVLSALLVGGLVATSRRWHDDVVQVGVLSLGLLGFVGSFQLTGHTASSEPQVVVRLANLVHVGAAALWTGGVAALAALMVAHRRRGIDSATMVARFSVAATASVVLVAIAGSALALVELDQPAQLWQTSYGLVLLAKLVMVGVVAAIGAFNHTRLVPAIVDGCRTSADRMRRLVRLELAAFAAVLALTAVLTGLSP